MQMIFGRLSKSSAFFYFCLTKYVKSDITVLGDIVQLERAMSLYMIDLQSRVPIFEQIVGGIKNMILDGEIKPGEKLPSVRELAKTLGVNPNTVTKAFQTLEREKIIYTVPGRGSYAADIITEKLKEEAFEAFDSAVRNAFRAGLSKEDLIERMEDINNDRT